jgi:hypothetical protein
MNELVRAVSQIVVHGPHLDAPAPGHGETILLPLAVRGLLVDSDQQFDPFALIEDAIDSVPNPPRTVLSRRGMGHLRTATFADVRAIAINKECPIHQVEFNDADIVTLLPCLHCFTSHAIERWLTKERAECPVCRYALPSVDADDQWAR